MLKILRVGVLKGVIEGVVVEIMLRGVIVQRTNVLTLNPDHDTACCSDGICLVLEAHIGEDRVRVSTIECLLDPEVFPEQPATHLSPEHLEKASDLGVTLLSVVPPLCVVKIVYQGVG